MRQIDAEIALTKADITRAKQDLKSYEGLERIAKVLLLPPEGIDEARRAAGNTVPILTVDMDASGTVTLSGHSAGAPATPPALDETALVLHTSGSTGRPKRVPLSQANLSISAGNVARGYALSSDDVAMCVMPLFHVHGLVASTLATLSTGGTVGVDVIMDGPLPPGSRPDLSVDGTIQLEKLDNIVFVGRPAFGQENSTVKIFKVQPNGEAISTTVKLGRASVNTIEIIEGLNPGDQVILSDMSQYDSFDRVQLKG